MSHAVFGFDDPSVTVSCNHDAPDGREYLHLRANGKQVGNRLKHHELIIPHQASRRSSRTPRVDTDLPTRLAALAHGTGGALGRRHHPADDLGPEHRQFGLLAIDGIRPQRPARLQPAQEVLEEIERWPSRVEQTEPLVGA